MRRLVLVLVVVAAGCLPAGVAVAAGDGPWTWPVAGPREVARDFAPPRTRFGSGHRGADLPSAAGAVVRAAGAGRVSYAGLLAGRGVVVVVHGGLRTTYEPVTASVSAGDDVEAGAALGVLDPGHEGCPVEACLHWGLRRGEHYLDPVRLVRAGPVRLLPLGAGTGGGGGGGGGGGAQAGGSGGGGAPAAEVAGGPSSSLVTPGAAAPSPAPPARAAARDGAGRGGASAAASAALAPPELVPVAAVTPDRRLPLGLVAVAALVAGLRLLIRPGPPPPPRPARSRARSVSPDEPPDEAPDDGPGPSATVLELDGERVRRRAG